MSDYSSSTAPDLKPAYKSFFESFYELSDIPPSEGGAASKFASRFTSDATINLAGKVASGTQEIITFREAMWDHVSSRKHRPLQIFTFGKDSDEVMIHGIVEYLYKNGKSEEKPWAAKAELVNNGSGEVKLKYYQVYI